MGGATPFLLKVLLFIKVGVAALKTLPCPILFLFQIALYQGFPMMYHLFHNSMWKVVRIAKTSDCKTLLILKWPPLQHQHCLALLSISITEHQHCLALALLSISIAQLQHCLALALLTNSIAQQQHCLAIALLSNSIAQHSCISIAQHQHCFRI